MKKLLIIVGILLMGMGFSSQSNAAIKEGEWSMTMTVQMDGSMGQEMAKAQKEMENMAPEEKAMMQQMMGKMGMQMGAAQGNGMTISRKQCITNAHPVPQQEHENSYCKETHSTSGNAVHFEVTCKDSHSIGDVTYNNDSMKGTIKSTQTKRGKEENVLIDLKGQYVGPCK